jgi:hypothetical protein
METKQNEHYKPARENGLKLCSPIHRMIDLSTGSSCAAVTQQKQSLNNNNGCYRAPLNAITRCIFPRSPKIKLRSNSAYRMLSYSHRMPHRANPPWYWVGSQWARDAQVQNQMLLPEQKSKEDWITWTQLTCVRTECFISSTRLSVELKWNSNMLTVTQLHWMR